MRLFSYAKSESDFDTMTLIVDLDLVLLMTYLCVKSEICMATFTAQAFYSCDLDPITLIYELDLHIPKTHLQTQNEVYRPRLSMVRAQTRQTDRTDR